MLKNLLYLVLSLLLASTFAGAEEAPLASYDLKIFDYQMGMSYDEAISVRAFHYTVYPAENKAIGVITSTYIEDVEFSTSVFFENDIAFKIIGRFDPKNHEKILKSLKCALGEGEETVRTIQAANGNVSTQSVCTWIYPGARIDVVYLSNNTDFATLSMVSIQPTEKDQEP